MAFLPAVTGILDADGNRVDLKRPDGSRNPIHLQVGEGIIPTQTQAGGVTTVALAIDPEFIAAAAEGAGAAVANIAALRAIPAADRQNGQTRTVIADADGRPFTAIFKTTGGTGIADDGVDVFIPGDKVIGDPDRWYRDPVVATDVLPGRLTAAEKIRVRQGYGGTLRARAKNTAAIADLGACPVVQDGITLVAGDLFFLEGQTPASANGLYVVGTVGGGTAPLTRAPEMAVGSTLLYGLRVSIAAGTSGAGTVWEFYSGVSAVVGSNALDWRQVPDAEDRARLATLYQFSGVPVLPGASKAAEIQAVLDDGNIPILQAGATYGLETALVVTSQHNGLGIYCPNGVATLEPEFAPNVSQADVSTNALIKIQGAVDTGFLDTTLGVAPTQGITRDARQCAVVSAGTLAAGQWVVISGHNDSAFDDGRLGGEGSGVTLTEIIKVDSTYAGGLTIPFASPASQCHTITNGGVGTACSVKGCRPVDDFTLEGLHLDASGGTVAVGVLCQYANNITLRRLSGMGFSRALINGELGLRHFTFTDITNHGECNSVLMLSSCMYGRFERVDCKPDGLRYHANGVQRWGVDLANRCTDIIGEAHIRHMCLGLHNQGGVDMLLTLHADDLDSTQAQVSNPAGHVVGVAYQGSTKYNTAVEDGLALNLHLNVRASNIRQSTDVDECAVFLYRINGFSSDYIEVGNDGVSPQTTLGGFHYRANGIRIEFCKGHVDRVQTRGVNWGWRHTGNPGHGDMRVGSAWFYGATSDPASNANVAVDFSYSTNDSGTVFGELRTDNMATQLLFDGNGGTVWATSPDWRLFIDRTEFDHTVTFDVIPAYNNAGETLAQGDLVQFDSTAPAGKRYVKKASGAGPGCCVVVMGAASGGYVLVSSTFRRAAVMCSTAAVEVGDLIEVNASKRGVANNSSRYPVCVAQSNKAAGSEGVVVVGPVQGVGSVSDAATAGTVLARGTSGEAIAAWFAPAGSVAASGLVRAPQAPTTIASALKADGTTTALVLSTTGSNVLQLGETAWSVVYVRGSLAQVEASGAIYVTSGSNNTTFGNSDTDFPNPVKTDTINEHTAAAGVTIDGFKIKDNGPDLDKWRSHELACDVVDVGGVVAETIITAPHQACTVLSCRFTNDSAITGDNVNNRTFKVYRRNGSGTQATIASLTTTTGVDFAAWISKSLGSLSNTALAADEVLTCEVTAAGGGAPTNVKGVFTVIVTYDR